MHQVYYGTPEHLSQQESYHFKKYVKRHSFQAFKHFRVADAIFTPVNLDCQNCRLAHPASCCENGQPFSILHNAKQQLLTHVSGISTLLSRDKQKEVKHSGVFEQQLKYPHVNQIKACSEGHCFFKANAETHAFCSIHRYAEQGHMNYLELKPFSCSLFPLEIIQDGNIIYVTSLTEETKKFSRWGWEYEGYLCVNKEQRTSNKHLVNLPQSAFSPDKYRPAWEWGRELLKYTFGEELIHFIESINQG